jgi:hypothetical protein
MIAQKFRFQSAHNVMVKSKAHNVVAQIWPLGKFSAKKMPHLGGASLLGGCTDETITSTTIL